MIFLNLNAYHVFLLFILILFHSSCAFRKQSFYHSIPVHSKDEGYINNQPNSMPAEIGIHESGTSPAPLELGPQRIKKKFTQKSISISSGPEIHLIKEIESNKVAYHSMSNESIQQKNKTEFREQKHLESVWRIASMVAGALVIFLAIFAFLTNNITVGVILSVLSLLFILIGVSSDAVSNAIVNLLSLIGTALASFNFRF